MLDNPTVRHAFRQAWADSRAEAEAVREEGGFVLRAEDGSLSIERWPRGLQNEITVPHHPGGRRGSLVIVATFHTHPNPEPDYLQEPGLTDIRAVRDDPDLRHPEYEGEYVIASEATYHILPDGRVEHRGDTRSLLILP
jgi:hypothetical protein